MADSPTIVSASLDDKELKASIDKMVSNFNEGLNTMKKSATDAVSDIQKTLQKLGDIKVDSGGSADGGSSKRAKAQNKETEAVKATTTALKEQKATLDQSAQAMQKASGSTQKLDIAQTMRIQLDLMLEKLREARSQYSSFVAMAAKATTTGDKGLFQFATEGVHRYEQEVKNLIPQIRTLREGVAQIGNVMAPQGHTIQNFVQSLQKANPELALLNQQYKEGNSLLSQQAVTASKYTEEIHKQAEAIRNSKEWQEKGRLTVGDTVYYDPERANVSKRDKQMLLSLEEQILQTQERQAEAERRIADETRQRVAEENKSLSATGKFAVRNIDAEKEVPMSAGREAQLRVIREAKKGIEDYAGMLQRVLGIQSQEVLKVNEETDSYSKLSAALKQLSAAYDRLSVSERNSDNGKQLVGSMLEIQRAMREIQRQKSRPVRLEDILAFKPQNLDQMADKLRELRAYKGGINLNMKGADDEIRRTDKAIKELTKDMNRYMSNASQATHMNNALTRSFNYMKNRLAFYFTVGASQQFVKQLVTIRGQYELLERSIGILFDSMQTGTKIFSELNAMAIKSPFTTMELGAAAKQLSAYNIAAKDVVDTTRRLADMAAAVGIPIERLTYALGQIKSYGYLNSRDARMFANAGIPLIQNLADMYTRLEGRMVSIGDVYDRIKKKQVSFEDTLRVVNEMTDEGGRFFNFQEKAADTLVVKLANLTLAWNNMMNELGKDNTGIINNMLGGLKTIFEHWRDIDAAIWGVVKILGLVKGAQFAWLLLVKRTGIELALANTLGQALGYKILGIGLAMKSLAANPVTWIAAAIVSVGYLYQKWRDLEAANEAFNKSVADGAKENINSINKFFEKYRKEINSIGSASSTDQEKMWERIREEIEKSTKNAQQYLDILEKLPTATERVSKASDFLEQQKAIQREAKRLADHGFFDMGGGFANDSLAKDLQEYEKTMNSVLARYGSLEKAQKDLDDSMIGWTSGHYAVKYYNDAVKEADNELKNFTSILDKGFLSNIMGMGTPEEQLANIRSFAQLIRDNFLATEEGQKISTEGQARLNREIDHWIAEQGVVNNLLNSERAEIEANRSAWETFFTFLNSDQKKALDYLVSTGKTSTDEFKKIWESAANEMKESSKTAYEQIQEHIADLRKTAPIVIDVIYKETKEAKDEAQKDFELHFLTPDRVTDRSAEQYLAEEKRLNTIYGRFNKKTGEDMVEWEERLGKEYQDNEKKLNNYNKMLEGYNKLSDEQKKKREGQIKTVTAERDAVKASQEALKQIKAWENFDFDQFKKGKKGSKKDVLGEAFAKVVEVTGNMQKRFKEYKKEGVDANTALTQSTGEYSKTLETANKTLAKFGIKSTKNGDELAKMELRDLKDYYESLLVIARGVGNTKGVEALEKAIASLNVEITKVDYKRITDGLNNELGKLKEEYELAVELDANPELGDMFANFMGIDMDELPRTFREVAIKAQQAIDKVFKDNGRKDTIDIASMLDKKSFDNWVKDSGLDSDSSLVKSVEQFRQYLHKVQTDESKNLSNEWSNLVEKYGGLQAKLVRIAKNTSKEQLNIIRKFGSEKDKMDAQNISNQLMIEQDPETVTRLQSELADLMRRVVQKNPQAVNIATATINENESQKSKAFWENFKNSNLYSMTFEDLSRVSTRAIQLIIDKLEVMKDKVKEDPASMKALIQSLEDARKELEGRSGTVTIVNAIGDIKKAQEAVVTAKKNLATANKEVADSENALSSAQRLGDADAMASAVERLRIAREKQAKAEDEAVKAENGLRKGTKSLQAGMETLSGELENVQGLLGVVSKLFAAAGDEDTAEAINAISEGFSIMTTVIMGVVGAMVILESTTPWLLAIAAALSVVVGLFSWLSSNDNAKITEQVEESELAVKRLENAYKNLEYAINKAYGMATIGANQAAVANKKLQLVELKRQLALERSRDEKDRDEDKIESIRGQIFDLQHEIQDLMDNLANELLGISSVADAATSFMDDYIEALRSGEDAMASFNESVDDMIANMVKKLLVQKIIQPWFENAWNTIQEEINARGKESATKYEEILRKLDRAKLADMNDRSSIIEALSELGNGDWRDWLKYMRPEFAGGYSREELIAIYEKAIAEAEAEAEKYSKQLSADTQVKIEDIRRYAELLRQGEPIMEDNLKAVEDLLKELGLMKDTEKDKALSALQQGIQGITEDTAGAIEAYMNGMSQQVYLQSDILTQIRDAVVSFDMDVHTAVISQILLQLQNTYQLQMSMHALMEGWTTPAGNGIRVELIS